MAEPNLKTVRLGGVDVPSANTLETMHHSSYILHARGGRLSEVPVEKVLLPSDRKTSPQAIQLVKAPDNSIYANLGNIICKSGDGGRRWTDPARVHDWTSESGVTLTPSGKLIAAQRYQRPMLPSDPSDLDQQTGSANPG